MAKAVVRRRAWGVLALFGVAACLPTAGSGERSSSSGGSSSHSSAGNSSGGSSSAGQSGLGRAGTSGKPGASSQVCTPGASEACQASSGCSGERTCSASGYEWSGCLCKDDVPLEQFGEALAKADCDLFTRCLPDLPKVAASECEWLELALTKELGPEIVQAVQSKTLVYDSKAAGACLAKLRSAECGASLVDVCWFAGLRGTLAEGAACHDDVSCASGRCVTDAGSACAGHCGKLPAPRGESCATDDDCQNPLSCADGRCTSAKLGEACITTSGDWINCDGLLTVCRENDAGTSGTCVPYSDRFQRGPGAACDSSTLCKPGLSCVTGGKPTGTCQPEVASGASCATAAPSQCPSGEFCDVGDSTSGTCRPRLALGQTCSFNPAFGNGFSSDLETAAGGCQAGLLCIASTCRQARALGEACQDKLECVSGVCQSNHCVADTCSLL